MQALNSNKSPLFGNSYRDPDFLEHVLGEKKFGLFSSGNQLHPNIYIFYLFNQREFEFDVKFKK